MKLALIYIKDFDGLIMNYPNDKSIYNNGKMNEGVISTKLGLRGIPNISEEIMVDRDISFKYTNENLHLSYISTEESVNKIKKAKKEGCKITWM